MKAKALFVVTSALGVAGLSASEVRWKGLGTVSTVTGGLFSGTGVTAGDPVEISMSYDSDIFVSVRSDIPEFGGTSSFYGTPNLEITVKIGDDVWTGQMPTIASNVRVMESSCRDFGSSPDWFRVTLDAARGGTFPSFPHDGSETVRVLKLEYRDDTAPAELFDVHTLPTSVTNLCAMTSAFGSVEAGTSVINFSIAPSSVQVVQPVVPASISRTETGIRLSWETVTGKSYRIEGSSNLRCWSSEGLETGTGSTLHKDLAPFGSHVRRFYRIVEP